MEKQKPLFIYDCDGTLQSQTAFVFGLMKKLKLINLSLPEFKQQSNESKSLIPGMAPLVRYTATLGNNLLLSGGAPEQEGCKDLHALKPYFQNWQFKGKDVKWGETPQRLIKTDPLIAKTLLEIFNPSWIAVLGDSLDDYILARVLSTQTPQETPIIFLRRGLPEDACIDSDIPVISLESGIQMQETLQKLENFDPKTQKMANILGVYRACPREMMLHKQRVL